MKSFAERLVARGAGRPIGLPLLTPRPAAHFEREMAAPAEAEIPVGSPEEATPSAAPAPRRSNPAPLQADNAVKPSPAHPAARRDAATTEKTTLLPDQAQTAPSAPVAAASSPEPFAQSVATVAMPERSASQEALTGEVERPARQPPLYFDEPHTGRITQSVRLAAPEPAAPAISIGRIEVQFLPQEKPVAPQRPEPQRTRGFEAYSRARRGLPR